MLSFIPIILSIHGMNEPGTEKKKQKTDNRDIQCINTYVVELGYNLQTTRLFANISSIGV